MAPPSTSFEKRFRSFQCTVCQKICANERGLKQHQNRAHPILSSDDSENEAQPALTTLYHPTLTALPVDETGKRLPLHVNPAPRNQLNADNPFHPFDDRLSFDWAHYHYVEMQSSVSQINKGLDLWLASKIQAMGSTDCDDLPWSSASELYSTIDEITQGNAPFKTVYFKYNGEIPENNPPAWMTQTYELCVRDIRQVIHQQLDTPDFKNEFHSRPYRQFQANGERVWSDMFSGDWAWKEASQIAGTVEDSEGAMLVPVATGLDKTTVSVQTGHQEYHPFYAMSGNLSNVARRGHGNGVIPLGFLPIPKTNKRQRKKKEYQTFVRQLYHACIAYIFEPLRHWMTTPDIVRCPDGHFRRAVYSIGPVIADYPEQVWLSGIVQGWCAKCMARPEDLDNPEATRRTHKKSDAYIRKHDPGILWDEYGIRDDVVVYLAAIVGYVPDKMIQCLASFLDLCYIFRRNAITASAIEEAKVKLARFHELREVFVEVGARTHCSLPRQHALSHFIHSIIEFGSPNGLCSSITESRHITAVKEPWRRSNRYNALSQMLVIINRMDKMATLRRLLGKEGLLHGTTAMAMALNAGQGQPHPGGPDLQSDPSITNDCSPPECDSLLDEVGPIPGPRLASSVKLAATHERQYPRTLKDLAQYLHEPQLERAFLEHLFNLRHPTRLIPDDITSSTSFNGKIKVFHSAVARFFAPSDACGAGGMQRQTMRCNPRWRNGEERMDTVFISQNGDPGMPGMLIAQLRLLFSFTDPHTEITHECALVNWFNTMGEEPDPVTGMWVVQREVVDDIRPLQVVGLETIVRGAHLLPVFGEGPLPEWFTFTMALEAFEDYFVNPYIDHHVHELLKGDSEVDAGTGSGKTLCLLLPALLSNGGISIVVSPLKQTQEAQVEELIRLGVSALAINEDTSKEPELWQAVEKCKYKILVVQPEQLSMHQGHWSKFARMIRKNKFTKHINYVHVDEAHFIHIAGINRHGLNAFRPAWGNLTQFRLKMPKRVHFQSLSGTQPPHIKKTIRKHLVFEEKKLHCIKISSNRPNICPATHVLVGSTQRLDNLHFTTPDPSAPWPDDYRLEKGMIFHQTIEGCTAAAKHLNQRLPSSMQEKGVIRAFHAGMSKDYREQVMKDFRDPDGVCRQLHVTEIASTGIDIRDLAYVVQYGMTNEVPGTLQRGGRCGRDGVLECIFLIMHELSAKNIDLSRFGNDVWALDDPDQPHSGNLTDKSKKEQRVGVGMAKIVQSTDCLRELFAKANGDTTENALKYTGRFCCNRHPGNSFRFGAFFPGKMLYQQPETHKVFYGDADEPYGTEIKAATIAADSESLKRARPKYRPTVLRPSLVHKLERWRYNAWRVHPLRSITPASFILNDSSIETLSKLTLDEHLLSVDDLMSALGQTATWKNKYAHAIFKEIQLFEAEVLALNIKAKAEEEERQKRRKLELDREMFRKADEEAQRRVREAALERARLERARLGPTVAPVPVQPASGARRSARLAKPAAAASNPVAAPAPQLTIASSSTAPAAPSLNIPARLLPTAPHAHGNAFSSSTQNVTQSAAERVQSIFKRVQNKEITLEEMHKLLGAHTYTTPSLF
ncbi:hypothetical protein D9611_007993 [Ephemerocybe angulata]|uniref:DNA 3'-5' helicase n=1 Tax=Ephemerocybe angulata TaxID=980116 RepID=A0A8H5BZL9_9AGAR|nr:hypothetical protein D9611_007993 [Tulosesus angulatus]